jgi:ABC-type multidrug transport system fused ATPase/permease subunit
VLKWDHAARLTASLVVVSSSPLYLIYEHLNHRAEEISPVYKYLEIAKLVLPYIAAAVCLSFPRRPDVFKDGRAVDELQTANAWSRLTYEWILPALIKAKGGEKLGLDDLKTLESSLRASELFKVYNSLKPGWSLFLKILSSHQRALLYTQLYTVMDAILNLAPQIALYQLLTLLQRRDEGASILELGAFWVVVLAALQIASAVVFGRMWFIADTFVHIPLRIQLPSIIFAKSMRKKDVKGIGKKHEEVSDQEDVSETSTLTNNDTVTDKKNEEDGDVDELKASRQGVVNLIGVDSKRIADFMGFANLFTGATIKLILAFSMLYIIVGWQALLAGLAVQILFLPLNIHFSKKYTRSQDLVMKARDKKLAVVNEALTGIRQIKFAALEDRWQKKVMLSREGELRSIWTAMKADIVLIALWIAGPILLSAGCIVTHALVYGTLDPATAFTTISLLSRIEATLAFLPELTTNALDAWISMKRIDDYLSAPDKKVVIQDGAKVAFHNATVAWPMDEVDEDAFQLRDVSLEFPTGELSLISGSTGSGKSLLLSAILGECEVLSGSITAPRVPTEVERNDSGANRGNWILPSAVAFVQQIPWIENCTLKANILFGLPYDEERYNQVIDACALRKDLEMLINGDETEIGPNGINLSGGQCWRLTLARALYSRAGILVLDDIFSAVDAHVGKHIYEKALTGPICEERTRILVSHHVALCRPKTKYEVHLADGRVDYAGTVEEIQRLGAIHTITEEEDVIEIEGDDVEAALNDKKVSRRLSAASQRLAGLSANGEALNRITSSTKPVPEATETEESTKDDMRKFVEDEKRETGGVQFKIYFQYLDACGGFWFWAWVTFLFLFFEALLLGRSWILRLWTQHDEPESLWAARWSQSVVVQNSYLKGSSNKYAINAETGYSTLIYWTSVYLGVSILLVTEGTFRYWITFSGSLKGSRKLFEKLIYSVLRAPLRWLDTVPVGRVLNRFTADFDMIDSRLAYTLAFAFYNLLHVIGIAIAG